MVSKGQKQLVSASVTIMNERVGLFGKHILIKKRFVDIITPSLYYVHMGTVKVTDRIREWVSTDEPQWVLEIWIKGMVWQQEDSIINTKRHQIFVHVKEPLTIQLFHLDHQFPKILNLQTSIEVFEHFKSGSILVDSECFGIHWKLNKVVCIHRPISRVRNKSIAECLDFILGDMLTSSVHIFINHLDIPR